MRIKVLSIFLTLTLAACAKPLDSHVPKNVTSVKGRIVFVSHGRGGSGGYYIVGGEMVGAVGGRQIFFSGSKRTLAQGLDRFVVYSDDGRDRREILVNNLQIALTDFDISPDGKTIVFVAEETMGENKGIENIYAIDIDGKNLRKITNYKLDYSYLGGVKFSPDGKKILFQRDRDWQQGATLFIMNIATGETKDILTGKLPNGAEADWSPDGKKITFVHIDKDGFRNIYLLNLDTGGIKQLTHFSREYYGQAYHPSYSPWGDQICFALSARDKNAGSEIFAINVDGSNLIRLTPAQKTKHYPYWAKDDYPDWGGREASRALEH